MRILALIGKGIDKGALEKVFGDRDVTYASYASVVRGVRRLEKGGFSVVMLVPDNGDSSWKRAASRTRHEYGIWSVLVSGEDDRTIQKAVDSGVFDAFPFSQVTAQCITHCLTYLQRQNELQASLSRSNSVTDWIERAGRLGSWDVGADGLCTWSPGVRRILGDKGQLTKKFSSLRRFVHPDDREIFDQANKATFEQGWPLDFEYRVLVESKVRHLHLHRRVELDDRGKVLEAFGLVRDVTPEREFENYLFRRDAILQVVGTFAERFLHDAEWENGIEVALKALGKAADVSRVFVISREDGDPLTAKLNMRYEWAAEGITPIINKPGLLNGPAAPTYERWRQTLLRRKIIAGNVKNFRSEERDHFQKAHVKSIMFVPVFVGKDWWGGIGLSDHRNERDWLPVELESMTMVADMLGAAILRSTMESRLKEVNREAEEAKTLALEASRAKSRFLANMSHEIRTPISGILGMAEMTITTGLNKEQREHLDMIRDAARALLAVVNDVLDLSKIEADKMELRPEDFDPHTVVDMLVRPFAAQAETRGIVFLHTMAADVPSTLHGDPDRLGQILRNLLSNSMKFTERGLIELTVETCASDADRPCLKFSVRDTGEGIPTDKLDAIFDSFTQADSSVRKKHQGTGLGLAISKDLVEMMGGTISVVSEPGRGATFSFVAFFDQPQSVAKPIQPRSTATPQGMHLNLLLAEDNPLNQKFLTHFLTMFGHTVTLASNGREAVDTMRRQGSGFDAILMDIQMPEMGGIEATRAIRSSDGRTYDSKIPIIALTAYAMKGDKERMLEAGMDDYVSKPVDMKELSSVLARQVSKRRTALPTPPRTPRKVRDMIATSGESVELDMEGLERRFQGKLELLGEILIMFVDEADQKISMLDKAIAHGDEDGLAIALHSITNIASHVLAMDIVEQARDIERLCREEGVDAALPGAMELRPKFAALARAVVERTKSL